MRTRVLTLLAAATVAVAAPSAASAATIVGTLAGGLNGVSSSTPAISTSSTFTSAFSIVGSTTGDFSAVSTTLPNLTFASLTPVALNQTITLAGNFGSFVGKVLQGSSGTAGGGDIVSFYALGTFTPSASGVLAAFTPGKASLTVSFNQTGGAGSVGGSYSLASPPSPVAEPATWGMMIAGAGMAGAAVRRRRSTKVAAA